VTTGGLALPRLIAYARTSTADQQNPKESLRWQLDAARTLTAGRAEIVEVVHDIDTSRSLPWSQRRQASALLGQLPDPNRGWTGIVVGEPQRAFGDTGQVQTVLAQLHHYRVGLWIPELQGPVDPDSEIHDIILSLFGGLSRAERNRLRMRVRTAMRAMVPEGRYLGGRPPYGYRLVRTGIAHPNPEKARQGIQLTSLVVDPETSQVVQQIFAWRAQGLGFRSIASRLTDAGIACPSAADRQRNPHRLGLAWSIHAVRAIVINPKYKGQQTYGRYHKVERLRSVDNPAAGNQTREIPSDPDDILAIDDAIDAIVTPSQWQAAQPGVSPATPGPRPDRTTRPSSPTSEQEGSRYALRGMLVCDHCGRRMQGNLIPRRKAEPRVGYRCVYRNEYPGDQNHPRTLFVAESRVIGVLDEWLSALSARNLDDTVAEMLEHAAALDSEPPEVRRARNIANQAQNKLSRYLDAIEKGMDPALYVERARTAQQELASATAVIQRHAPGHDDAPSEDELRRLFTRLGSIVGLLHHASPDERRQFYQELGLHLAYQRHPDGDKVRASLGVEFLRVGGGT
jgi:site-specific DNA recombinase